MIKSAILFCTVCLLLFTGCKSPQTKDELLSAIPDPKTLHESYVSNPDNILSAATVDQLNSILRPLDQEGTAHIDVVFVKSIGDHVPKDIAHELFRAWKIGKKETNNGLLILVVKDQKRIEFETGYGLEGVLPDMICKRIQEDHMVPNARNNDYDKAITDGVNAVISRLKKDSDQPYATSDPSVIAPSPPVATGPDSSANTGIQEQGVTDIDPGIQQPSPQTQSFTSLPEHSMGLGGLIVSVLFLIFYIVFAATTCNKLNKYRFKKKWLNPVLYLVILAPVAFVIYLNLFYPTPWHLIRTALICIVFLWAYVNVHFFILSSILKSSLKDKSRHDQYLAWQQSHEPAETLALKIFSFPFLKAYWETYTERQQRLRYSPMDCDKCGKPMTNLSADKEKAFLSKGQLAEEKIDSIDYDVWECNSCHEHLILDYKNLKSVATECPECHFITLKFTKRKVMSRATTSDSGYGYTYSTCANCAFVQTVRFEIAQISAASSSSDSSFSSSSDSSSSSSDSSSSSGGDSGGGGSGSSW